MITASFSALLYWSFWIFPEIAWRFIPYRQAAHQISVLFLIWHEPLGGDEFLLGGATLLRSILVSCNAVCVLINWIIEIGMFSFYWIFGWAETNWNSEYGNVLDIFVNELIWGILEGKDRGVYMHWIKNGKLVLKIGMVISGWMDMVELSTGKRGGVCHMCGRSLVRAGTVTPPGGKQSAARRWHGQGAILWGLGGGIESRDLE